MPRSEPCNIDPYPNTRAMMYVTIALIECQSNHKLAIERSTYSNIERHRRFCDACNVDVLGDEYHFVLECVNSDIVRHRKALIPLYYRKQPNIYKFVQLMMSASNNKKLSIKLAKFIRECKIT